MKKKILRFVGEYLLPFIAFIFVKLIYLSNKKVFHYSSNMDNETFILSIWHGDLLMQPFNYRNFKPKGVTKVIVSEHSDGEVIRKIVSFMKVGAVKGSSTRGGVKALLNAIKSIKNGTDIAITPDGPKGPIHKIADGIVLIAQKTDARIICFCSKPTKFWKLNSWDNFMIPKPFGKIDFYAGEPFSINGLSKDEAKAKIKLYMDKIND